ncbi:MAG TPA: carboxymuconolactone decarboxylase family protein [Candidatus Dormibacteraeota bacterium]|nr:carboxymuconolactone decarboxylase family protein [Candidatus Dormibacteraeota bacterium]
MPSLQRAAGPLPLEFKLSKGASLAAQSLPLGVPSRGARAIGGKRRLHVLAPWREVPFCGRCEKAALARCESLTLLPLTCAPDEPTEELVPHFSAEGIVTPARDVAVIHGWTRLDVGFGRPAGDDASRRPLEVSMPESRRYR